MGDSHFFLKFSIKIYKNLQLVSALLHYEFRLGRFVIGPQTSGPTGCGRFHHLLQPTSSSVARQTALLETENSPCETTTVCVRPAPSLTDITAGVSVHYTQVWEPPAGRK